MRIYGRYSCILALNIDVSLQQFMDARKGIIQNLVPHAVTRSSKRGVAYAGKSQPSSDLHRNVLRMNFMTERERKETPVICAFSPSPKGGISFNKAMNL